MGDRFQKKINKLFSGMPNVSGTDDYILIAGFDEWDKDPNMTLEKVYTYGYAGRQT